MAGDSTRKKLRDHARTNYESLKAVQDRMVLMGQLVQEAGSEAYIHDELPQFIASMEVLLQAWERFWETL